VIVQVNVDDVPWAPVESVAVTATLVVPMVVGVPLITQLPPLAAMVSPAGSPVAVHVIVPGGTTPVSVTVTVSGVIGPAAMLLVWFAGAVTVIVFGDVIVMLKSADPDAPVLSVAVTCTANGLPVAVVGVPLIKQLAR
jgi:hypothetical protein